MLLIIVYIHLHILKSINCVINNDIVPYSYFPLFMLLIILYINLQTLNYINCIFKFDYIYIFTM